MIKELKSQSINPQKLKMLAYVKALSPLSLHKFCEFYSHKNWSPNIIECADAELDDILDAILWTKQQVIYEWLYTPSGKEPLKINELDSIESCSTWVGNLTEEAIESIVSKYGIIMK